MGIGLLGLDTACWLLVGLSGDRVPAAPWALGDSVVFLARNAPPGGAVAAARLPSNGPSADPLVAAAVRRLVAASRLVPTGSGWSAGFEALGGHRSLSAAMGPADRRAVESAAQRLKAMATIWSKKAVA